MSRTITIGVFLFGVACAAPRQQSPSPDLSTARAQIDSLWAQYSTAAVAGDVDAIARLYVDSAYLVELGLPTVRGKAALHSIVRDVFAGVKILESRIDPELTEMAGDRVLQFGGYRDVLQPAGQPAQVVVGRYAAVLQRDSTASWRVSRLIAFPDSTTSRRAAPK